MKKIIWIVAILIIIAVILILVKEPLLTLYDEKINHCATEGNSLATDGSLQKCCRGLKLIPIKEPYVGEFGGRKLMNVGSYGICTAKCGNGICDATSESFSNCPADCP